jgi:hypothetical protein
MNLVKNNYQRQHGTADKFSIEFDTFPSSFKNHFVESQQAAEEIYSLKKGKFYVMYSGGLDSEFSLGVFLSLGIEVVPVIIKLNPHYNDFDINYAFEFCKSKNLNPVVIDIDFDHFVKSGKMLALAKKYKAELYHRSATIDAITKLDGTVVMGDNEPYISKDQQTNKWNFTLHEHDYAIVNLYEQNNISGTPHFGCYTPEMTLSFLTEPVIQDLANNNIMGKLSSNSSKHLVYNRYSNFNLKYRPKYTGYEIIEQSPIFNHESFKELEEFGKTCNGVYTRDYFEMMKNYI